eukprot:TRINITY_DN9300_c0_g1_i1.p1 TRINITY_DN9300_c0_g1~~TRINITY_DN9300_c0_g1_i1.p1  ORF type:complete len:192 (-),score=21.97 TRINITY_DN9300_c0_g1_i1:131-706(-)
MTLLSHYQTKLFFHVTAENCINSKGMVTLAMSLHSNTTLSALILSSNEFGDEGLAKFLIFPEKISLTHLDLSNNSISDRGMVSVSGFLKKNSSLTHLDLQNNTICDGGAHILSECLKVNITLRTLLLFGNSIGLYTPTWNDINASLVVNKKLLNVHKSVDQIFSKTEKKMQTIQSTFSDHQKSPKILVEHV